MASPVDDSHFRSENRRKTLILTMAAFVAVAAAVSGPARIDSTDRRDAVNADDWHVAAVSVELCLLVAFVLQSRRRAILSHEQSELADSCRQLRSALSEERTSHGRTRTENQWLQEACRQSNRTAALQNVVRRLALAAPDGFVAAFQFESSGRCTLLAARGLSEQSRQKLSTADAVGEELTRVSTRLEDRELRQSAFFQSLSPADRHRIRRAVHVVCSPVVEGTRWIFVTTALPTVDGGEAEQHAFVEGIVAAAASTRAEASGPSQPTPIPVTPSLDALPPHEQLRGIVSALREAAGVDRVTLRMLRDDGRVATESVASSERPLLRGVDQVWRGHEQRLCRHLLTSEGVTVLGSAALRGLSIDTLLQSAAGKPVMLRSKRIGVLCLSSQSALRNAAACERLVDEAANRIEQVLERLLLRSDAESAERRPDRSPPKSNDAAASVIESRTPTTAATETSESFASVTHELRAPMLGILGMTDLVLETELNPEQRKYLAAVRSSSESLLQLVNDLLDASKIEAGALEIESVPFELRPLLGETLLPFDLKAREKGLRLEVEIEPGVAETWIGDPLRLRQVVTNLVGNAIKFTERGRVAVHVSAEPETWLCVRVADTGIGIPADRRDRIFQKFAQADVSISRRFGGTGLGLSITRELVERMGGRLEVESEVGRGSTFSFHVRFQPERRGATAPVSPVVDAGESRTAADVTAHSIAATIATRRVLLAEDLEINQLVGKARLEEAGYSVVVASNGREAVERWTDGRFDLVLMDVQMPVLDGLAATAEIRRRESVTGRRTPIFAMTACAGETETTRCLAAGMDACLSKPVDVGTVEAALCEFQERRRSITAASTVLPTLQSAAVIASPFDDIPPHALPLLREFLPMYLESSTLLCRELREAIDQRDARRAEAAAHRLNGASSSLALTSVAALAQAIESGARNSEFTAIADLTSQVESQLAELRSWDARRRPANAGAEETKSPAANSNHVPTPIESPPLPDPTGLVPVVK